MHINVQATATHFKNSLMAWMLWWIPPLPFNVQPHWLFKRGLMFDWETTWNKGAQVPPHTKTPTWNHSLAPNMALSLSDWIKPQVTLHNAFLIVFVHWLLSPSCKLHAHLTPSRGFDFNLHYHLHDPLVWAHPPSDAKWFCEGNSIICAKKTCVWEWSMCTKHINSHSDFNSEYDW